MDPSIYLPSVCRIRLSRVRGFVESAACDGQRFNKFFHGMLERGVYLAPSAFEAGFVSAAHSENDIADTIDRAAEVFGTL